MQSNTRRESSEAIAAKEPAGLLLKGRGMME